MSGERSYDWRGRLPEWIAIVVAIISGFAGVYVANDRRCDAIERQNLLTQSKLEAHCEMDRRDSQDLRTVQSRLAESDASVAGKIASIESDVAVIRVKVEELLRRTDAKGFPR